MMLGVPIVIVFTGIAWLLITRVLFRFNLDEVPGGKQLIDEEIAKLGRTSQGEKAVIVVFALAAFFWIVPGLLEGIGNLGEVMPWLGIFNDTVIAIAAGILLFLIPGDKKGNMRSSGRMPKRASPGVCCSCSVVAYPWPAPSPRRVWMPGSASRSPALARSRSS